MGRLLGDPVAEGRLMAWSRDREDQDLSRSEGNYSKDFVRTANDLQILDAISECYEEYKILSRGRTNRL